MARRSFSDIMSGGLTGAGTGGMVGAVAGGKTAGPMGALYGAGAGLLLGGIGGYFSGKADQPQDKLQMDLGMAQLDRLEEENKERRRIKRMKKAFSGKIGKAFRAATRTMGAV